MALKLCERLIRFVKFAGVGVIGTLSHYATLLTLVRIIDANAVLASCAGYIVGGIVNYFLNYQFTFASSQPHTVAMPKFISIAIVGFFINAAVMASFINYFRLHFLVAQVMATAMVLFWNFLANTYWTFKFD